MMTLAQRNQLAQAKGWRSYGQRRYWEARWSDATARRLAGRVCGSPPTTKGAIMCSECNRLVNPKTGREGDWRARLVRAAQPD